MTPRTALQIDVIEEVLVRLPVEQVLRCKLLSQTFYDLIQTHYFVNKHFLAHRFDNRIVAVLKNLHNNDFHWMVSILSEDPPQTDVFVPPPVSRFRIIGSCNGLLVFQSLLDDRLFTVCNPATREYMSLQKPSMVVRMNYDREITSLGFGYDSNSGDYKIVKIKGYTAYGPGYYVVEIWTMSTNTWEKIIPPMPSILLKKGYRIRGYYGLLVNNILYWLAFANDSSDAIIISFDPSTDTFGRIVLPADVSLHNLNLIDFMGDLTLLVGLSSRFSRRFFDIWVMDRESLLWTKRFSIGPFLLNVVTTAVCINGNLVLHRVLKGGSELIFFDLYHNKVEMKVSVDQLDFHTPAWSYIESLVSIPTHLQESGEEVQQSWFSRSLISWPFWILLHIPLLFLIFIGIYYLFVLVGI